MQNQYRVVVIGGGVVGASVLYHLAKFGWTDCAIIEREVLTAGSSWHAAGGIHALNADPNMAALQAYTIDLLAEVEQESGENINLHMTGGITIATTKDRWDWLQGAYRTFQAIGIDDCHLMTPEQVKERCPVMDISAVIGGLWADREGYIDTTGTVRAYAMAAKKRGADIIEHNRVLELKQRADSSWDIITEKGTIHAEHVVNAAGLWAKQVGRMVGLELPVSPLSHHYLVTEEIPEIAALDFEVPMTVDPDGFTYMRQDQKGMLIGIYEREHKHWMMDGAPWNYGSSELLENDFDRIENELALTFNRYPVLEHVGIKNWVNGAFTFSPDGNPLVGPVRGLKNYWLACGVMAGFLQGGGVGKTLAEWMIYGETEADAWPMDIARYGDFASNKDYIKQTTGQFYSRRFVMTYPNEQLWAGRPLKKTATYDAQTNAGAKWGVSWGLEVPLMFGPKSFSENKTMMRSNAFEHVAAECKAVRKAVGLLDITGFSRFEITGRDAPQFLDYILASKRPGAGRARLAPMLGQDGKLKGDLTLFNWGNGRWWIMGSYYLREWHLRWFHERAQELGNIEVYIHDIADTIGGFSISGPASRRVLEKLTHQDVSNETFKFAMCKELDIGMMRARVGRLSVLGELGYEINVPANQHSILREALLEAGESLGIREIGYYALNSLRLEKSFGIWSAEFTQRFTATQTGLERWIDWNKDFYGKEAALKLRAPKQKLVTLKVEAEHSDALGYEPVWADRQMIGHTTSGGYGHTLGHSLAMAMIDSRFATPGTKLKTHIVGRECDAEVLPPSPYDPKGERLRG